MKEISRFTVLRWEKIRLKTSTTAGENFEIYSSQKYKNKFFWR